MDEWYMWNAFCTTGTVLDYLRYKGIRYQGFGRRYDSEGGNR